MEDCKPSLTPMEQKLKLSKFEGGGLVNSTKYRKLVGSLIYLKILDHICHIQSLYFQGLCRNQGKVTGIQKKRVLRYIQGIKYFGILYKRKKISHLLDIQMLILQVTLMIKNPLQVI
jgi:hypothetical protein